MLHLPGWSISDKHSNRQNRLSVPSLIHEGSLTVSASDTYRLELRVVRDAIQVGNYSAVVRRYDIHTLRQQSVEPVFSQITEVRGFRRCSLGGLAAVRREWDLVAAVDNLLRLSHFVSRSAGQQLGAIG